MFYNLKKKPEEYRRKFALGVSSGVFLIMFFSWSYFNGFLGFSDPVIAINSQNSSDQVASVVLADNSETASPFENTQSTFSGIFGEITKQYEAIRDSMASVLVPFVTNIDVYEKTK